LRNSCIHRHTEFHLVAIPQRPIQNEECASRYLAFLRDLYNIRIIRKMGK
jgi:vacuolar-type H+-ATPase subunit C/Vma6